MKNNAAFLVRSTQLGSSMVMTIMLLMNPFIKSSFNLISTASLSACISRSDPGWYSYSLNMFLWGDRISVASHDFFLRRSFPRQISDSLTVVQLIIAGVVPKVM